MRFSNCKDINKAATEAQRNGWTVTITGGNHLRWEKGNHHFTTGSTPRNPKRALDKIRSQMRHVDGATM